MRNIPNKLRTAVLTIMDDGSSCWWDIEFPPFKRSKRSLKGWDNQSAISISDAVPFPDRGMAERYARQMASELGIVIGAVHFIETEAMPYSPKEGEAFMSEEAIFTDGQNMFGKLSRGE